MAEDAQGDRLWIGAHSAAMLPTTLAALRSGTFRPGVFVPTHEAPAAACLSVPRQDVAWYVGYHAAPELAPWLNAGQAFRLRRWPDFGRIRSHAHLLRLAAALGHRAWTPHALSETTGLPASEVHRFLSAASLAGTLTCVEQVSSIPAPRPEAANSSPWTQWLGGLRRRLGLAFA